MAWIESHQSLRDHPKLYALMERLSLDKPAAIGHLHLFWWWCVDHAPDGLLKRFNNEQLARAGMWVGDPKVFVSALADTGFLNSRRGVLIVHDWHEFRLHYDVLLAQRERKLDKLRKRVARFRAQKKRKSNIGGNVGVTQKTSYTIPTIPTIPTLPTKHTEPLSPLTPPQQELVNYLHTTQPLTKVVNPDRFVRRITSAYNDQPDGWILGELRKLVAWLADHGEREARMRDWSAFVRHWLRRAYGDPVQRKQINQLISGIGKSE